MFFEGEIYKFVYLKRKDKPHTNHLEFVRTQHALKFSETTTEDLRGTFKRGNIFLKFPNSGFERVIHGISYANLREKTINNGNYRGNTSKLQTRGMVMSITSVAILGPIEQVRGTSAFVTVQPQLVTC